MISIEAQWGSLGAKCSKVSRGLLKMRGGGAAGDHLSFGWGARVYINKEYGSSNASRTANEVRPLGVVHSHPTSHNIGITREQKMHDGALPTLPHFSRFR